VAEERALADAIEADCGALGMACGATWEEVEAGAAVDEGGDI